jgi:hypothetical protein
VPLLLLGGGLLAQNGLLGPRYPVNVNVDLLLHLLRSPQLQEGRAPLHLLPLLGELARQHAQHQIEHEERAQQDERNVVHHIERDAYRVVRVVHHGRPALHGDALEHGEHGEANVVERGDAVVGPLPQALHTLDVRMLAKGNIHFYINSKAILSSGMFPDFFSIWNATFLSTPPPRIFNFYFFKVCIFL